MTTHPATLQAVTDLRTEQPALVPHARIVGRWVWIATPTKPDAGVREWLKAHGYRWNQKRRAWQNPCGVHSGGAKNHHPWEKYGAVRLTDDALVSAN